MKALRRILIALWGLANVAAAVLFALGLIKHSVGAKIVGFFNNNIGNNLELWFVDNSRLWSPILIGLLFLLIGILLLIVALSCKRERRTVTVHSDDGNAVQINRSAIDTVVRQAVSDIPMIESVEPQLHISGGALRIVLRVTLPAGSSVPELGAVARRIVSERLQQLLSVIPREITVEVADLVEAAPGSAPFAAAVSYLSDTENVGVTENEAVDTIIDADYEESEAAAADAEKVEES